jgi:pantetheine-phosphate adenylyltransferase
MIGVYPGSFDPPTFGHLDCIERAASIFPTIIVALGVNPSRKPLFSAEERLGLLREICAPYPNVRVDEFSGLLVEYVRRVNARVIVRGVRAQMDFEYELHIAHANADLAPELDTVFLPTRTRNGFISASLVREIASHGGDVSRYAPPPVCAALGRVYSAPPPR